MKDKNILESMQPTAADGSITVEQHKDKPKVLVLLGPTATGKSHCAIEIAKRYDGEIISGDSMLVYRDMNIGTAKPTADELAAVPHHLVNILPPDAGYSVADFQVQAKQLIDEITARGHLPIIAGGTGLYIKALLEDYQFNSVSENTALRRELEEQADKEGALALYARLEQIAPQEAARIHPNNVRRVIRALEAALSGEAINQFGAEQIPYDALVIGLTMERSALYARIDKRVDMMLAAGLEQEVHNLLESGVSADCQSMQSIGYRQMVWYLDCSMPYEQAVDKLKQATRNFAKRQMTWYRKMPYIEWITLDAEPNYEEAIARICEKLALKGF